MLLTVLVTVLSLVAISSRVASSREEAALGAMANAAREAAEYGFSEIVAEMNRDINSYRWVTSFSGGSWQAASKSALAACGVASPELSGTFPASAQISSNRYGLLSYELQRYDPPWRASDPAIPDGHPCADVYRQYGNLLGGTGSLTIQGKVVSPSGRTTTYVLKRNVSVRRKPPIEAVSSLWREFPSPSDLVDYTIQPPPLAPDFTPGELSITKSARLNATTYSQPSWQNACKLGNSTSLVSGGPASTQILRCWFSSLSIGGLAELKVEVGSLQGVEIYLTGSGTVLSIADGAALYGSDPLKWSRLRLYGQQSGSCSAPAQDVSLALFSTQVNLQNAFLRFPSGRINYTATSPPTNVVNLAGVACGANYPGLTSTQIASLQSTLLSGLQNSSMTLFNSLGGAYGFSATSVFAGTNPILRVTYRGIGLIDP